MSSSSIWKRIFVAGAILLTLLAILGYRAFNAWKAFSIAQTPAAKLDVLPSKASLVSLPMETHYGVALKAIPFPPNYPPPSPAAYRAKTSSKREEAFALARHIVGSGFFRDWTEGTEGLNQPQPSWMDFDTEHQSVNYGAAKDFTQKLNHLGRFLAIEGQPEVASKIHLASFAATRQLISIQKQGMGLTLFDAMIAIGMTRGGCHGLLKLGQELNWQRDFFTLDFRERFEAMDQRFSLVTEALRLERSTVASIFRKVNKASSKKAGYTVVVRDPGDVLRRSARFYPSDDFATTPYERVEKKLEALSKRCSNELPLTKMDYVKGVFFPMDLVEKVLETIAIPNLERAIEREYQRRAILRGCYLAFALAAHRASHGSYPSTLAELGPRVKTSLRIDPYTGRSFPYRRVGKSFLLWSAGKACAAGESEPALESISIVPWVSGKY